MQGDKKTIHPIVFFLLNKFPELQKRAYLAKFLLPVAIPEEYSADSEVKIATLFLALIVLFPFLFHCLISNYTLLKCMF